ncbi:GNAT family N-acetyltransferase [Candidatus Saccharibacteria bacterium]|nr:GNAT family N-acetyltransferase [Candidatus Saccharibacteria bacterium]
MGDLQARSAMCYEYMKELNQFRAHPVKDEFSLRMLALEILELTNRAGYSWFPICDKDEREIGFFVVSMKCPSADVIFEHNYVDPAFRRQGYSRRIHEAFIEGYAFPAVYGVTLFKKNTAEKKFISDLVKRHGGTFLDEGLPTKYPELKFYRFLLTR